MANHDRWWVRRHTNGWNAYVYWSAEHQNYSASTGSATAPLSHGVPHVRFYEVDVAVARANADRGAHHDCDDTCPEWEEFKPPQEP
jgi:hypothetical protein